MNRFKKLSNIDISEIMEDFYPKLTKLGIEGALYGYKISHLDICYYKFLSVGFTPYSSLYITEIHYRNLRCNERLSNCIDSALYVTEIFHDANTDSLLYVTESELNGWGTRF